jgi:FSR family fosmidomycin resistance protein-like MFS transporter
LVIAQGFLMEALSTYLTVFLTEGGADLWMTNIAFSTFQAAGVVGAFLSGALSDRWGRKRILFTFMLVAPVLMVIFLNVHGWMLFPVLLGLGFTTISLTPVMMALVQESYPKNRSLGNGVYMALNFALRSGMAVVVGAIGDALGLRTAFAVSAAIPLLGLFVVSRLPGRRAQR